MEKIHVINALSSCDDRQQNWQKKPISSRTDDTIIESNDHIDCDVRLFASIATLVGRYRSRRVSVQHKIRAEGCDEHTCCGCGAFVWAKSKHSAFRHANAVCVDPVNPVDKPNDNFVLVNCWLCVCACVLMRAEPFNRLTYNLFIEIELTHSEHRIQTTIEANNQKHYSKWHRCHEQRQHRTILLIARIVLGCD